MKSKKSQRLLLTQVGDHYRVRSMEPIKGPEDQVVLEDGPLIPFVEGKEEMGEFFVPIPKKPSTSAEVKKLKSEYRKRQKLSEVDLRQLEIEEGLEVVEWREKMRRIFLFTHPELTPDRPLLLDYELTQEDIDEWELFRRSRRTGDG